MEQLRAFIAIPLPPELLAQLATIQRRLDRRVPHGSVRWVQTNGIHLTLKFLGDVAVDRVPDFERALEAVACHAPRSTFTVEGLGCFPNPSRPRVVWIGVQEPSDRLAALQDGVEEAMSHFGFQPEGRGFSPHLTLGRIGRRASRDDATQVGRAVAALTTGPLGEVHVSKFALIRSTLKPTGAEYTTLSEFRLSEAQAACSRED